MKRLFSLLSAVFILGALAPGMGSAASSAKPSREDFVLRQLGAPARVAFHSKTGLVRFVGTAAGSPLPRPAGAPATASPAAVARAFLEEHGNLFGLVSPRRDLELVRSDDAGQGRSVTRFRQVYEGVPVLAGELVVGTDRAGNVIHANGETLPALSLDVTPRVDGASAVLEGARVVADLEDLRLGDVDGAAPSLWIYDPAVLGGPGPKDPTLVWRTEITSPRRADLRELVLIDAQTGDVLLHFSQIHAAKNRKVCNANNRDAKYPCTSGFARVEGQGPTGNQDVDLAYDFAGGVYDFYRSRFNRDSIDGKGMALVQTVKYCDPESPCPFQNAFWDGKQMVYGEGYASADDVVGHEMAHGVTERTAGLFYWFQAGAINESLSDIVGEHFDLTNGRGTDGSGVRWLMGEDLPGGAIRSMSEPNSFGDPERMTDPEYDDGIDDFTLEVEDSGGVHSNSGVGNKAAFLMTDGGSFNGRTVSQLGISKVAKIHYEVVANVLTSGSDYQDLHEGLFQACHNLVGSAGISAADCTEVRDATLAVEMDRQPANHGGNFPAVDEAPMCPAGQVPTDLFYDNMENPGANNWTKMAPQVGAENKWGLISGYATSGKLSLYTEDQTARSDTSMAMSNGVPVPSGTTTYLRFSHAPNFEYVYDWFSGVFTAADGGVVEYSTNGGSSWNDLGSLFDPVANGYYGTIYATGDNPLGGRQAFTDVTGGYYSSRANLSSLAGNNVKFRFRVGTDTGNVDGFFFGWLVDDVRVYTCASGTRPGGSAANLLVNPGFEFDDDDDAFADGWSMNTSALRMPTKKRSGSYALRHKAADNEKYSVSQRVSGITPGTTYGFSGFVNAASTSKTVDFTLQVTFRNAAGKVVGSPQKVKRFTDDTAGSWKKASRTMTAPTGAASAQISMVQKGLGVTVFADDFTFKVQ